VVAQVANSLSLELQDIRALLLDPVDLRGLPFLGEGGRAEWAIPCFLPSAGSGIILLDELNAAPAILQAKCYQLVLDRRVGEYRLPGAWTIVAAGNRDSDRAVTAKMPTRFGTGLYTFRCRRTGVVGVGYSIHDLTRSDRFPALSARGSKRLRPRRYRVSSPRSWEFVSRILAAAPDQAVEHELFTGAVGVGAATEFSAFLRMFRELPSIDAILLNPTRRNACLKSPRPSTPSPPRSPTVRRMPISIESTRI